MSVLQLAVIGNPAGHGLLSAIQSEFGRQHRVRVQCGCLDPPIGGFASAAQEFLAMGGHGLSVSAPFKSDAFAWADRPDDHASRSRSVNVLWAAPDGIAGFNTEGPGFLKDLERLNWRLQGAEVLILGAGIAARSVLESIYSLAAKVTVASRTMGSAEPLRSLFPNLHVCRLDGLPAADLVIHATSASGHGPPLSLPRDRFGGGKLYDLDCDGSRVTPFLRQNAVCFEESSDGLGMLAEQAALFFRLWTGETPDCQPVLEALRRTDEVRRFIAGAVCPKCGAADQVYVVSERASGAAMDRGCASCDQGSVAGRRRIDSVRVEQ